MEKTQELECDQQFFDVNHMPASPRFGNENKKFKNTLKSQNSSTNEHLLTHE